MIHEYNYYDYREVSTSMLDRFAWRSPDTFTGVIFKLRLWTFHFLASIVSNFSRTNKFYRFNNKSNRVIWQSCFSRYSDPIWCTSLVRCYINPTWEEGGRQLEKVCPCWFIFLTSLRKFLGSYLVSDSSYWPRLKMIS